MQFSTIITLFAAAVSAAVIPNELVERVDCPQHTTPGHVHPWTCCVYSYTYDQCCHRTPPPNGLSDLGFRTCEQFVADGANDF